MTQEFVFKPVSSTDRPDSQRSIGQTLPIKTEHSVPAVSVNYIRQIAEHEGLQSCLPTSLLNGLIHIGAITAQQAEFFQQTLTTSNRDLFTKRTFGKTTFEVMAAPVAILLERIKETLGVDFKYQVIGVGDLSIEDVELLLQQQLLKDSLIVGGDEDHAVLVTGYDQIKAVVRVIDPDQPRTSVEKQALSFANQIKLGDPWLAVLSK